jgi:hypothetical protein
MSTQYRLVQLGKTASGSCSAGPRFVRAVAPRIYLCYYTHTHTYIYIYTHTHTHTHIHLIQTIVCKYKIQCRAVHTMYFNYRPETHTTIYICDNNLIRRVLTILITRHCIINMCHVVWNFNNAIMLTL